MISCRFLTELYERVSSIQHLVGFAVDLTLDSSTLHHIIHTASYGFQWYIFSVLLFSFNFLSFNLVNIQLFTFYNLTKQQLYDRLPPISQTIRVRRTRHAGHCWRSKDGLCREGWMVRKNSKKSWLEDNEYIHRYRYVHFFSSTDSLFRCITTLQCDYT